MCKIKRLNTILSIILAKFSEKEGKWSVIVPMSFLSFGITSLLGLKRWMVKMSRLCTAWQCFFSWDDRYNVSGNPFFLETWQIWQQSFSIRVNFTYWSHELLLFHVCSVCSFFTDSLIGQKRRNFNLNWSFSDWIFMRIQ